MDKKTADKIELWFFRDMFESNRLALFSLFGFKSSSPDVDSVGKQQKILRSILSIEGWEDIKTYDLVPRQGEYYPPHCLCAHADKKWIRMGRFEPQLKRWYYSGTSERSQWAQVEGDEPTHWQQLPPLPSQTGQSK